LRKGLGPDMKTRYSVVQDGTNPEKYVDTKTPFKISLPKF
jgi:hypothetical protein